MNHHHSYVEDSSARTDNNNNNTSLFISPGGLIQSEVIYPSFSSNSSGLSGLEFYFILFFSAALISHNNYSKSLFEVSDIVSNQLEDIFNRIDRMIRFLDFNKIVPTVLDSVMIHL